MAPTLIQKFVALGAYGDYSTALSATPTPTVVDAVNGNYFQSSGNDLLVIHNPTAGPLNVTISSQNDPWGRTKDITAYAIGAGLCSAFGPFKTDGWTNCGKLFFTADALLEAVVVQLRPQ